MEVNEREPRLISLSPRPMSFEGKSSERTNRGTTEKDQEYSPLVFLFMISISFPSFPLFLSSSNDSPAALRVTFLPQRRPPLVLVSALRFSSRRTSDFIEAERRSIERKEPEIVTQMNLKYCHFTFPPVSGPATIQAARSFWFSIILPFVCIGRRLFADRPTPLSSLYKTITVHSNISLYSLSPSCLYTCLSHTVTCFSSSFFLSDALCLLSTNKNVLFLSISLSRASMQPVSIPPRALTIVSRRSFSPLHRYASRPFPLPIRPNLWLHPRVASCCRVSAIDAPGCICKFSDWTESAETTNRTESEITIRPTKATRFFPSRR